MSPEDYIKYAVRTESPNFDLIDKRVLHGVIGCCTESGELLEAINDSLFHAGTLDFFNLKEELGDMLWYIAVILDALKVKFEVITTENRIMVINPLQQSPNSVIAHCIVGCSISSNEMLDLMKKSLFYGRDVTVLDLVDRLKIVMWNINVIIATCGWTLEQIMTLNIHKLKKRYPEQFTNEKANNRDLEGERDILEQPE